MALKNRSDQKVAYAKIKDGKFYLTTDKEHTTPFDSIEGTITDLYLKEETYEGKTNKKLYVVVSDETEKTIIGFGFDSSYTTSLISFLKNANLGKKLEIHPKEQTTTVDGVERKKRSLLVSQDGTFLHGFFKRGDGQVPDMVKVKFNGKDLWDKTDFLAFYEKTIGELKNTVGKAPVVVAEAVSYIDEEPTTTKVPWDDNPDDDGLPF